MRQSNVHIITGQKAFILSLILSAIVLLVLAPKAAVNVDEMLHYPHAKKVVNWYFTGGQDASSLDTPVHNLKYYGQSVDNFTALINRVFTIENEFLTRHFTGAFFFWVLLVFAGLLGKELGGSYWISALAVVGLILTPRIFGQAFGNLKDIPFAAGYTASILFIIRFIKELPQAKWSTTIYLALAIAFTNSVRIGGLILFAYLALGLITFLFVKPFLLKYIFSTKSCFVRLTGQGLLVVILGYFAGLLFWPYALQNVFHHPLESLAVMEHYKISIKQLFNGEVIWSTALPWNYLPKWIWISTPEFVLLGFIYFIAFLTYKFSKPVSEQLYFELFALFTAVFPLVYVIVIGSNLYSGIRQMLFVLPISIVLSMLGAFQLIKSKNRERIAIPAFIMVIVLMVLPLTHQAKTFPVDYVYFNAISGGNKNAWSNYEYDYYFQGMKEATDFLIEEIGDKEVTVALNCQLPNYFEKTENIDFVYTRYLERSSKYWDYALFGINYIHPWQLKNNTWQSTQTDSLFYHKGNPLVIFIKRENFNGYAGIQALERGELEQAEKLINEAIELEPNNVWLFVNLANLKLVQQKYKEVESIIKIGRTIHPYYEPFYLLDAQKHYDQGKYEASLKVLNELIAVNPRYMNAAPLLKEVKEKLN